MEIYYHAGIYASIAHSPNESWATGRRERGEGGGRDENWTIYARNRGGYDMPPDGREGPEAHSVTWERVQIPFISRPCDA